jgi:biotin-dependent carboxylase-like uncharacterized protein
VTSLYVEAVGPLAAVEDRGRPGLAHLGVARSGVADRASYELANRLVGNRPGAGCIEATLGQLSFRADGLLLVAVTGAPVEIRCGGRRQGVNASFRVAAGETVTLGVPTAGLRSYVAVRGGIDGEPVLGSLSWDTMGRLGTPPLQPGDVLRVGEATVEEPTTDLAPVPPLGVGPIELPLLLGPRDDWFTGKALKRLAREEFTVTPETDRVGARLDGPELPRRREGELASEGMVRGALQVPTGGRPTLFLADHPVTGGYPVIGVVPAAYVDRAAQAVPGQVIRFRPRP